MYISMAEDYQRTNMFKQYQSMRRSAQEGTESEPNHQGKVRVRGTFPNAIVTKEQDNETNSDPWYNVTLKYHLGEEKLYQANKTTLVKSVEVPTPLQDYKMRMGGRKSRRGSRKSRRRSRRSRK